MKPIITLPKGITNHGIVGHDGPVYTDVMVQDIARAAVEADRQGRMPSDAELDDLSDEFHGYSGNHTRDGYLIPKFDHIGYARALLSRYGSTQPVASEATLDLVSRLRALARYQHDDMSVADEAADALLSGQPANFGQGETRTDAGSSTKNEGGFGQPAAEAVLRKILQVVQRYLPPDGLSAEDAMGQIIALVDPWPLSGQPAARAKRPYAQSSTLGEYGIIPECDTPSAAAPVAQEPVAYLDVGADGYLDLGSDKSDDELMALPQGRNMLGIIGTYGANGYVAACAQVKPDLVDLAREGMEVHVGIPNSPEYRVCAELVRVAEATAPAAAQAQPWQALAAAMYQAAGAYDMPVRILDALSAAANGEPFAHMIAGLLPVESPVAQEPVIKEETSHEN